MTVFGSQFRGIQFTTAFVVRQQELSMPGGTLVCILLSLFHAVWGPSPWDGSFIPLGKTFLGTDLEACFHGDSKSAKLTVKRTFSSLL